MRLVAYPYISALLRISGKHCKGMPNLAHVGACHVLVWRSINDVRLALVTSVTYTPPLTPPAPECAYCKMPRIHAPVSINTSHASMVPNRHVPLATASATAGTWSNIQRILYALKYVLTGRPVMSRKQSWWRGCGRL